MTSLEHWIEEEKSDTETTDSTDSWKEDTPDVSEEKKPTVSVDWEKHTTSVDYDKERKCCPHCLTPSPKEEGSRRYWNCPSEDCGCTAFTMSYFEFMKRGWEKENDFLFSVDWVEAMEELES